MLLCFERGSQRRRCRIVRGSCWRCLKRLLCAWCKSDRCAAFLWFDCHTGTDWAEVKDNKQCRPPVRECKRVGRKCAQTCCNKNGIDSVDRPPAHSCLRASPIPLCLDRSICTTVCRIPCSNNRQWRTDNSEISMRTDDFF